MQSHSNRLHNRLLLGILALTVVAGAGISYWKVQRNRDDKVSSIRQLIDQGMHSEAMVLLSSDPERDSNPLLFQSHVECLIALRRYKELHYLYFQDPAYFRRDEVAALIVARSLCSSGKLTSYRSLRNHWQGRESREAAWLAFDADQLIRSGRTREAKQLLCESELPKGNNAGRLTRLAMLHQSSPEQAWDYLRQAYQDSPQDPTVRLFRAQVLEAAGRNAEARVEYVAACLADTTNPAMRDQLACFYQRRGNLYQAMTTWSEGVDQSPADFIEFSLLFWHRVAHPAKVNWDGRQLSPGRCQPLVRYLIELPSDRWWDEDLFARTFPDDDTDLAKPYLRWLHVLDRLSDKDVPAASDLLLEYRDQLQPTNRSLYRYLCMWIDFMECGELDPLDRWEVVASTDTDRHQFLSSIDELHAQQQGREHSAAINVDELTSFLQSDHALPGILMATGWVEAGIRFHPVLASSSGQTTDWYEYAMVQALRMNRSPDEALAYLQTCAATPELDLVHGEILLGTERISEAHALLRPLASFTNAVGRRATWLLCMDLMGRNKVSDARHLVMANDVIANSVMGKELLAQIAVAAGDDATATHIMTSIQQESIQAKAYLAREAYSSQRWDDSQQLTVQLTKEIPDAMQLRNNLRAINAAKRASAN